MPYVAASISASRSTLIIVVGPSRRVKSHLFFFQAEDGIRDIGVTGVQTCALPISMQYRNARFGFTMTYPSSFVLDPESIPEGGDSARFWTVDRRATAVVTGIRNGQIGRASCRERV